MRKFSLLLTFLLLSTFGIDSSGQAQTPTMQITLIDMGGERQVVGTDLEFGSEAALELDESSLVQLQRSSEETMSLELQGDQTYTLEVSFTGEFKDLGESEETVPFAIDSSGDLTHGDEELVKTNLSYTGLFDRLHVFGLKGSRPFDLASWKFENAQATFTLKFTNFSRGQPVSLSLYNGPKSRSAFNSFGEELNQLFYAGLWSVLRWISIGVSFVLEWIYTLTGNWVLTILLMAVIVRIVNHPASKWGMRTQEKTKADMARIAPELQRINKEYKGLEKSEKIMELYKTENISPYAGMASAIPLLLQIPFFIAMYAILSEEVRLVQSSFLWIDSLAKPDALFLFPFHLPWFGNEFNLLPILMGLVSGVAAMISPISEGEKKAMYAMAVSFAVLFYNLPAGLIFYWTTSNVLQVIHQVYRNRQAAASA